MAETLKKHEQKPTGVKAEKSVKAVLPPDPKAKPGKKKGKILVFAVLALLLVAAVTLLVLAAVKNLFGGRDMMISFLTSMDSAYESLEVRELVLADKEFELSEKEEKLNAKEESLSEQTAELQSAQEAGKGGSFENYIGDLSEERVAQLRQLAEVYSNMDAALAAAAISNLDGTDSMALVLYYMEAPYSAEVMNCLDAVLAARITEEMLE